MICKAHCAYQELKPVEELKKSFNPSNPNTHSKRQIDRIKEILEAQGARSPAVIDSHSGLLIVGHGRVTAAIELGWTHYPVDIQTFDTPEMAYAHMVADNGLAEWSKMDRGKINRQLEDLGPDLNLNLLGLDGFSLDLAEKEEELEKPQKLTFKVTSDQKDQIERALKLAKNSNFEETGEASEPGASLSRICEVFVTVGGG